MAKFVVLAVLALMVASASAAATHKECEKLHDTFCKRW